MIRDFDHDNPRTSRPKRMPRAVLIGLLLAGEILMIALAYQFLVVFQCDQSDMFATCRFLRSLVARIMVMAAVALVIIKLRPKPFLQFAAQSQQSGGSKVGYVHGLGVAILMVPLAILMGQDHAQSFFLPFLFFVVGGMTSFVGAVLWIAPLQAWAMLFRSVGVTFAVALGIAFVLPDLATLSEPFWRSEILTVPTFVVVNALLQMMGQNVYLNPDAVVLGLETFRVNIATNCSGIEGLALVTILAAIYAWLFREEIRVTRFLITVLPVALAVSWLFNSIRIAALILIGQYLSPQVAIDGFHSYAGWLFFTLLSLLLIGIVHRIDWLHKRPQTRDPVPRRRNLVHASLVPFSVFMITLTLISAIFPKPELGWPVVTVTVGLTLVLFLPALLRMEWKLDWVALVCGVMIAGAWVLLAPPPAGTLNADLLVLRTERPDAYFVWAGLRILGTAVCIPIAEELLFRGYLMSRIAAMVPLRGKGNTLVAIGVTTALFAAMHQRWELAAVSGLIFSALALRNGRVTDAIQAHVTANAAIAVAAFISFDWSLI